MTNFGNQLLILLSLFYLHFNKHLNFSWLPHCTVTSISRTFDLTVCRSLKSGGDPRFPPTSYSITNRVVISVGMLDYFTVLVVAVYHSRFSLDAETTTSTDRCQSTNMRTLRLTFGHYSFDLLQDFSHQILACHPS